MTKSLPVHSLVRAFLVAGCLGVILLAAAPTKAQSGSWQVHEGTAERHNFGSTIPNGDNEGFLSGAQIPDQNDDRWASASDDLSLRWSGPGGTPCRSQANYTYFQTVVTPGSGERFEIDLTGVDDAARVTVFNSEYPNGMTHRRGVVGLREDKTVDLAPALVAGAPNRVVITLADVCGAGNGLRAQLRSVPGDGSAGGGTMVVDGTEVKTGPIQVTLEWDGAADLDLFVTDPSGASVGYDNPSVQSGGLLDVDALAGCSDTGSTVENIVWQNDPPPGTYRVRIDHYQHCGQDAPDGPEPFTATLRRNGEVVETWRGTVGIDAEETYTFESE